jgi:hypothetical protein
MEIGGNDSQTWVHSSCLTIMMLIELLLLFVYDSYMLWHHTG